MKRFGIVSYNMYGNFTNYGSALQTFALHKVINNISPGKISSVVVDYCPDILSDKDVLNPMKNMWDKNEEALYLCQLSLPAIRINYQKFLDFFKYHYQLSSKKYNSSNFNFSLIEENLDGYVCGSDTIFCIDEFGFDNGFYANFDVMKGRAVAYAASFGDTSLSDDVSNGIVQRISNFKAVALREYAMIPFLSTRTSIPIYKVIDPTLLLSQEDYDDITAEPQTNEKYLLLYARRYNENMEIYADNVAKEYGWKVIEISLRANNTNKHEMRYDAGVEEFLSLIKNAQMVITNSYHGMIFAIQYQKPFFIFTREQCNIKIAELMDNLGVRDRMLTVGDDNPLRPIDYVSVNSKLISERLTSLDILTTLIKSFI